jgi:prepilin-type N-terminal cleavage/methylation domain-containing protein
MKKNGFTIVELMIAISASAVFVMLITTGIIQVSRMYKQATVKTAALNAARELQSTIAGEIQYSASTPVTGTVTSGVSAGYNYLCVGQTAYYWKDANSLSAAELSGSTQYFYKSSISGPAVCSASYVFNTSTAVSPLPKYVRATSFNLAGSGTGPYTFAIRLVAGDKDLFESNDFANNCVSMAVGGQFCATVALNSTFGRKVE